MKNKLLFLVTSSLVLAFTAWAGNETPAKAPNCDEDATYAQVTKAELTEMVAKKAALVIDVNSKSSFEKAHIPTAIHYDTVKADFPKALSRATRGKKDALIVSYCGGPQCTAWLKAAKEACKMGYTNIKHFKEGISGWNKSDS